MKDRPLRWILGSMVVGLLLGIVGGWAFNRLAISRDDPGTGIGAAQADEISTAIAESTRIPVMRASPSGSATRVPSAIVITGVGSVTTNPVTLPPGLSVIDITVDGGDHFTVEMLDTNGDALIQLINGEADWSGSRAIAVPTISRYVFRITASAHWQVEIAQPDPGDASITKPPVDVSGTGSTVIYYLQLSPGAYTVHATHAGQGRFAVRVLDSTGTRSDVLFDASGSLKGDAALDIGGPDAQLFAIDVVAFGPWTLSIDTVD